eukprot:7379089-Alexandrium_andersonii.AAC.1
MINKGWWIPPAGSQQPQLLGQNTAARLPASRAPSTAPVLAPTAPEASTASASSHHASGVST